MRVDPKTLVRRLTPTATRHLEAAVGRAVASQHGEVEAEHLLRMLVDPTDGDAAALMQHLGRDLEGLRNRVERHLSSLRQGGGSRPILGDNLLRWVEEAWLLASLEWGETRLRTGALLVQWMRAPTRYCAEGFAELEDAPVDSLSRDGPSVMATTAEGAESAPQRAGDHPQAAQPMGNGENDPLQRFCSNFTEQARQGRIDPIFGRDREVRQMVDILARRKKNNPILVGEPGVGKTALVEGLARAVVEAEVPESLRGVEIVGLDLGLLQAGASVRGEFENRLKSVIRAVQSAAKPTILFIDEAHTLIGSGGPQGGGDAANLLKPALARGELRTIAATTWSEYKKYFEKDAALERRFQLVKVDEPGEEDAIRMLRGLVPVYEEAHGVTIRDEAVVAAVKLAHRYIPGRQLPDKSVDLLDTTAARARVQRSAKPERLVGVDAELEALRRQREALSRDRDEAAEGEASASLAQVDARLSALEGERSELQHHWRSQKEALERLLEARRVLRDGGDAASAPGGQRARQAREAREHLRSLCGEQPMVSADVDADAVARTVAAWTGIPLGRMRQDTATAVLSLEQRLRERIVGQSDAVRVVGETLRVAHAGIASPEQPMGVLLFVGPSGVGKTETARALAEELFGGERFLTRIHMTEFQEKHSVSRLIGSPPGYVGYGEGGVLTEAVRQRPYQVVLLDECEKADLEVMNLFYQVFDKGKLNDGEGRTVHFHNTVIILTSNLGSDELMRLYEQGAELEHQTVVDSVRPVLSKHFKPALLNRMTVVPFAPLGDEGLRSIARMELAALEARIREAHGACVEVDDVVVDELVRRCRHTDAGARDLGGILRRTVMSSAARELLGAMAQQRAPGRVHVGLGDDGAIRVRVDS